MIFEITHGRCLQIAADVMDDLWGSIKKGLFDGVRASVERLLSQGFPLIGVLNQLHDDVIMKTDLCDTDKALICEKLGEVRFLFCMLAAE